MINDRKITSWKAALAIYWDRRQLVIFMMGLSSGIPLLLGFSTLSWWLSGENISKTMVTGLLIVATPYAFKFLWAPLFDHVKIPIVTKRLGQRRSWLLVTQIFLIISIISLGASEPTGGLTYMAFTALLVAFFSASQDIVVDAYRIEILREIEQGAGAAASQAGYRVGLLITGAAPLALSDFISWFMVYLAMSSLILIGVLATFLAREPIKNTEVETAIKTFGRSLKKAVLDPLTDFCKRRGWVWVLLFILLYKYGDAIAGALFNPFFREIGFTGTEVALTVKTYGVPMTIAGILVGGLVVVRLGIIKALFLGGVFQAITNLLFVWLASKENLVTETDLFFVVAADNFSGGIGSTAFVAFLSSMCNLRFTATQFALFTSFMALGRTYLAVPSGWLVDQIGWENFFIASTFIAIPALLLLIFIKKYSPDLYPVRR
ncbi:MAG: MFS transporter [Rhodospirillales bacterium]|nr:MFS transporter [Rhodospirillales bacterium]|tara:strand:+ start:4013 stop:5314 length:1302 start_codon:yes stop_codon:yes gene_type:complete